MGRGGVGIHTNILHCNLLELIIRGQLCCIDDRVSHDVGNDTDPQSEEASGVNNFLVAVHRVSVRALIWGQTTLSLHADLDHISRVGN